MFFFTDGTTLHTANNYMHFLENVLVPNNKHGVVAFLFASLKIRDFYFSKDKVYSTNPQTEDNLENHSRCSNLYFKKKNSDVPWTTDLLDQMCVCEAKINFLTTLFKYGK